MKRLSRKISLLYSLILFTLLSGAAKAQVNLVPNPGFETHTLCPDEWDEAKYCVGWRGLDTVWNPPDWAHAPNGVPDYQNRCSTIPYTRIPNNYYFNHDTHDGDGMMQLIMYNNDADTGLARDYLQCRLTQQLSNRNYYVRFYTVLEQISDFAVNNIGAYFDDGSIDTTRHPGAVQSQCTPQVVDTSIISDTLNWKKIEGIFTASGTEKFMTIGHFTKKAHTNKLAVTSSWTVSLLTHYLVDDVLVMDSDRAPFAGNDTLINLGDSVFIGPHETLLPYTWYVLGSTAPLFSGGGFYVKPATKTSYLLEQNIMGTKLYDTVTVGIITVGLNTLTAEREFLKLYPNPATDILTIEHAANTELTIYNTIGVSVWSGRLSSQKQTVNIQSLPDGIYTAEIVDVSTGEKIVRKIIKE